MAVLTFKEALREALDNELNINENVILMGENLGSYGGLYGVEEGLLEKYGPERIISTPISKSAVIGSAIGSAITGMVPVVEISSSDFLTMGLDSLINQAAKVNYLTEGQSSVPLVLRVPTGVYKDSSINQAQNLENLLVGIPGIKVVVPSTPQQAKDLLMEAIEDPEPVVFIEDKNLYETEGMVLPSNQYFLNQSTVERSGSDLTIVSWGNALNHVNEVANMLNKEGIFPEIINPLTLHPIDIDPIIESVIKTGRLMIVHDGPKTGGIGAEIASQIIESEAFNYLDSPIIRVTGTDTPVPFNRILKESAVVNNKDILNGVYTILENY